MQFRCAFVLSSPLRVTTAPLKLVSSAPRKPPPTTSMKLNRNGQAALYGGIAVLATILTNRLVFTPLDSLALTQSRSDILGVIAGATLVLYGVGKAEIADKKQAVELEGVDVKKGFDQLGKEIAGELDWAASALIQAVPNVRSCVIVVDGAGRCFAGRFRDADIAFNVVPDGVIDIALQKQERAYLADMKTVPVKELEFGFLPSNCQAVVVQPVSRNMAIVLGADKARPLTGDDFGWLQAISDRLAGLLVQA